MPEYQWPTYGPNRGRGFWTGVISFANIWKSRRKLLRVDQSNAWRAALESRTPPTLDRSAPLSGVIRNVSRPFRIVIIADTGEGDTSQYCLVPLLRAAKPDFMIINGDVAYPAGETDDFHEGFFRPYHNLGIPIWATPGNHEYYAARSCDPFHFTFCDPQSANLWEAAGLVQVPQPGFYWELRDPTGSTPLVILGLDSGMSGNLDGHSAGWLARLVTGSRAEDTEQHSWLQRRLELADAAPGSKVVILFHIPGLVDSDKATVHLDALHRIIAAHPSVKAVFCGHIHNHQQYGADTFKRYMKAVCGATPVIAGDVEPHYIVSGNGGATIERPRETGPYPTETVYPKLEQWVNYATGTSRLADTLAHGSAVAEFFGKNGQPADDDPNKLQSFLILDVSGATIRVSHVRLDSLDAIYTAQPDGTTVDIDQNRPAPDADAVERCSNPAPLFTL